jgi:hypothetical protein
MSWLFYINGYAIKWWPTFLLLWFGSCTENHSNSFSTQASPCNCFRRFEASRAIITREDTGRHAQCQNLAYHNICFHDELVEDFRVSVFLVDKAIKPLNQKWQSRCAEHVATLLLSFSVGTTISCNSVVTNDVLPKNLAMPWKECMKSCPNQHLHCHAIHTIIIIPSQQFSFEIS